MHREKGFLLFVKGILQVWCYLAYNWLVSVNVFPAAMSRGTSGYEQFGHFVGLLAIALRLIGAALPPTASKLFYPVARNPGTSDRGQAVSRGHESWAMATEEPLVPRQNHMGIVLHGLQPNDPT